MSTTPTPAQAIAQQAAELLWACATSEDSALAASTSPVFRALEGAFLSAVKGAYGLYHAEAARVLGMLGQYGPHEQLEGMHAAGVASFVEALANERQAALDIARDAWARAADDAQLARIESSACDR